MSLSWRAWYNVLMDKLKKLLIFVAFGSMIISAISTCNVFASEGTVETIFWGSVQDDNEGCGVYMILNLILDILTYGIAIAAAIGITISGITYLTAKDNEQQSLKARKRIINIVIGLAAYAVLFVGLGFILPGNRLNQGSSCSTTSKSGTTSQGGSSGDSSSGSGGASSSSSSSSSSSKNSSQSTNNSSYKNKTYYKQCMKKAIIKNKKIREGICKEKKGSERIAKTAELLAASSKKASVQCYSLTWKPTKWKQFKKCKPTEYFQYAYDKVRPDHWKKYTNYVKNVVRTGASCDYFVGTVVKTSGYDSIGLGHDSMKSNMTKDKKKWKKVKKAKRGDICQRFSGNGAHIKIYLGKGKIAEASSGLQSGDKRWGGVTKGNCNGYTVYRAIK